MRVRTVAIDEATGDVKGLYDDELASLGFVHNYTQLFSLHPAAYLSWGQLITSIRGRMDLRRYELATLAAAAALRCRYCVSAHSNVVLEREFFSREEVEALLRDYRAANLEPVDVAVMELAEKVALHAYRVTDEDFAGLRSLGLSDSDIFDVVLAAAARSFFSKTLDAMGCESDIELTPTNDLIDVVPLPRVPTLSTS